MSFASGVATPGAVCGAGADDMMVNGRAVVAGLLRVMLSKASPFILLEVMSMVLGRPVVVVAVAPVIALAARRQADCINAPLRLSLFFARFARAE